MPIFDVNPHTIRVKTAAQWAVDGTIYGERTILVTSDETYAPFNFRKIKLGNAVDTWSSLSYLPIDVLIGLGTSLQNQINNLDLETVRAVSNIIQGDIDATGNQIENLGTPTVSSHAATKGYVDGLIDNTLKPQEGYTPAGGLYPTTYGGNAIQKGDTFRILAAGTMGAIDVNAEDLLIALTDTPGQTDANWQTLESNRDQGTETVKGVFEVATQAEAEDNTSLDDTRVITVKKLWQAITKAFNVLFSTDDLTEGATNKYFTDERAQDAVANALTDGDIDWTYNDAGDQINSKVKGASEEFSFTGIETPSQITSNQNDYSPSNFQSRSVFRINSDAERTITGFESTGIGAGEIKVIENIGSFNIILTSEDAASSAANRLLANKSYDLPPNTSITLMYDATSTRWRVVSKSPENSFALTGSTVSLFNPVDAATYYFGHVVTLGTSGGARSVQVPLDSKLRGAQLFIRTAGSPDAQNSSFYIRVNDTTDHTISTTAQLANGNVVVSNFNMNVDFANTDVFEIKWSTPTWATNPTSVFISWIAYFEK